jgi:hypothetical protein
MSDQTYSSSLRGGSTISPAGYKSSSFPLTRAHEKKNSRDLIVPETRPAVTYLQAESINIRTYATGLFFSVVQ